MSPSITPSDSYVRYLTPPHRTSAPDYIKKLLVDYRILHQIGFGGFANVYEGTNVDGVSIAVKVPKIKFDETVDSSQLDKFSCEAEIWDKLEHENIVGIYASDIRPVPYIAMELMGGGSLKELMKNHDLTLDEAYHIMQQILQGLSYAHRMASVHRDLKPENILFTSNGVAKITDWGIGKFMASAGKSHTMGVKGTPDYCAPEQFAPHDYGRVGWETDIFQVGVMFYEMMTGINPFAGEELVECMGKVLTYNPEPPSLHNPDIPEELDNVIMKAIAKRKEDRWESGAVMLNELKRVISGKVSRGPKCSECGNVIDSGNRKLRCKDCKKYFCETCEGWINKVTAYRGYKVKTDHPLCEDCYDEAVDSSKKRIDAYIKKNEKPKKLSNSIGMKFVPIPGKNYYMGKYTVTQKEWKRVMGATPWKGKSYVKEGDDYPATYISWNDCQQFVKKLNSKEGRNRYRLPTEEEWEHACRAGSTTKYCFGDDESRLAEYAWYNDMDNDRYGDNPKKVGQKKPNKWGLYDMHGNVWEWCQDWYDDDREYRVYRGGGWCGTAGYCGSSFRFRSEPGNRNNNLGVRLVRSSD